MAGYVKDKLDAKTFGVPWSRRYYPVLPESRREAAGNTISSPAPARTAHLCPGVRALGADTPNRAERSCSVKYTPFYNELITTACLYDGSAGYRDGAAVAGGRAPRAITCQW